MGSCYGRHGSPAHGARRVLGEQGGGAGRAGDGVVAGLQIGRAGGVHAEEALADAGREIG